MLLPGAMFPALVNPIQTVGVHIYPLSSSQQQHPVFRRHIAGTTYMVVHGRAARLLLL